MQNTMHTELTIYKAEEIHTHFLELLSNAKNIALDMHKVIKIDLVGIQLLISLVKSFNAKNLEVTFTNFEDNILQEIKACHCDTTLGL